MIINIKNVDRNKIKQIKSHERYYYYNGYVTIKDSKHVKINRVNPLYIIINKVNGYFEEINKVKYLTLVPTNKSKEKKYTKLWCYIIDLTRTVTKKSYDYDETYIKKS